MPPGSRLSRYGVPVFRTKEGRALGFGATDPATRRRAATRAALLATSLLCLTPGVARAQASASFPELPGQPGGGAPPPPGPVPYAPPPASPPPPDYREPVAPPPPPAAPSEFEGDPSGSAPLGVPTASTTELPAPVLGPALLPYRRGLPVPPGYHLIYRPAHGLLVGGGVTLGVGYLLALATGAGKDGGEKDGALAIPVIGPWIALSAKQKNPCSFEVNIGMDANAIAATEAEVKECVKNALSAASRLAIIAGEGAVQAFGAALLIAGAVGGRRELERDDVRRVRVTPTPVAGRGGGVTVQLFF